MKTLQQILFIMTFILIGNSALCQEFEVPTDVILQNETDYRKYEKEVISGINWLERTPLGTEQAKRTAVTAFLMRWITGTPTVTIELMPFQVDLSRKNPDLLLLFLGGWTRFSIENPGKKNDALAANKAAINSVLQVYSANLKNGVQRDRNLEKMHRLTDGELESWIKKQL